MAYSEGEPRRISRREALGRAARDVGITVTTVSSIVTIGTTFFIGEKAKREAKPIPITDAQHKAAREHLKESDQAITRAADEGRYTEIPRLASPGDPKRREAQEAITIFEGRQAEITESTYQTLDPLMKPALVTMTVGFATWLAGLANIPPRRTPDYTGQPQQPNAQPV